MAKNPDYDAYIALKTASVVHALRREAECITWGDLQSQFDFAVTDRQSIVVAAAASHHVALVPTSLGVRLGELGERAIASRRKQKTWETQSAHEQAIFMAIGRAGGFEDLARYAKDCGLDLPELRAQMRLLANGVPPLIRQQIVALLLDVPEPGEGDAA